MPSVFGTQFTVPTGKRGWTPGRRAIGHARVRFKRTCVGSNGILEYRFLSKTRTVLPMDVPINLPSLPECFHIQLIFNVPEEAVCAVQCACVRRRRRRRGVGVSWCKRVNGVACVCVHALVPEKVNLPGLSPPECVFICTPSLHNLCNLPAVCEGGRHTVARVEISNQLATPYKARVHLPSYLSRG
jgi:hypothetical protein